MDDLISRQAAIDVTWEEPSYTDPLNVLTEMRDRIKALPSAQPERLTDDDFETIRIHLNAFKENLCNQQRWGEAEEYQRIIDRFVAFASAQPEQKTGKWYIDADGDVRCTACKTKCLRDDIGINILSDYCPNCGADMRKQKLQYGDEDTSQGGLMSAT